MALSGRPGPICRLKSNSTEAQLCPTNETRLCRHTPFAVVALSPVDGHHGDVAIGDSANQPPSTEPLQIAGGRHRTILLAKAFGASSAMIILVVEGILMLAPTGRESRQIRNSVPLGDEYAQVNRVSDVPANWTASVCAPPLYALRNPVKRLPNALDSAVCRARINPPGEAPNILIARFRAELPMQVDLQNEGYEWYAFTYFHGAVLTFATFSSASSSNPASGLTEAEVLQSLHQFGFKIYHGPGAP